MQLFCILFIFVIMRAKLVVLSGAGISVESGVAPFRGKGGLWNNADLAKLATIEAWRERPEEVLEFYNQRRSYLKEVEPNSAHFLLARMERDFEVVILTQNVDDLHERAGSSNIIHLHGELTKARPEDVYNERDGFCQDDIVNIGYEEIHLGDTGGKSKTQLRPHIVFFGEPVPKMEQAAREVSSADILLVVGTSLQVYPAASLLWHVPKRCELYVIDPARPEAPFPRPVHHIQQAATTGMEEFAHRIGFLPADK